MEGLALAEELSAEAQVMLRQLRRRTVGGGAEHEPRQDEGDIDVNAGEGSTRQQVGRRRGSGRWRRWWWTFAVDGRGGDRGRGGRWWTVDGSERWTVAVSHLNERWYRHSTCEACLEFTFWRPRGE